MTKPGVLIVGAGAVGLVMGFHLQLAGADITYLVRQGRAGASTPPRRMYNYDTGTVQTFADYGVIDNQADLHKCRYAFVVVTLDGHASRTPQGVATLRSVGDAIRGTDATVVMVGVGAGLYEHHLRVMALDERRLLRAMFQIQTHQIAFSLRTFSLTDTAEAMRFDVGYKRPANGMDLRVTTNSRPAAKQFAAMYGGNGISRCGLMPAKLAASLVDSVFPVYAACEIAGWPSMADVAADKELWDLACAAQREILRHPRNGRQGRVLSAVMRPRVTAAIHQKLERDIKPFDLVAFNRYHHGGKVRAQNVEALKIWLGEGLREGIPMPSLAGLLSRVNGEDQARQTADS